MNNNNETSATRLKQLRKSFNYTQEKMAEELGVSISLYKGIESGKCGVSRRTAEAVENRFGVSADYIFCGTLRDGEDVLAQIQECNDTDKMKILFTLLNYFMAQNQLTLKDENINEIIKRMFEEK